MTSIYRIQTYLILFLQGCSCSCCCGFWRNFRDTFKIHKVCDISDNVLSHSRLISSLYLIIAVLRGPCLRQSQGNRQRNSQETSSKWLSSNNEKLNTRTSFASQFDFILPSSERKSVLEMVNMIQLSGSA